MMSGEIGKIFVLVAPMLLALGAPPWASASVLGLTGSPGLTDPGGASGSIELGTHADTGELKLPNQSSEPQADASLSSAFADRLRTPKDRRDSPRDPELDEQPSAFSGPDAPGADRDYDRKIEVLQTEVSYACSNEVIGEARANLAYLAFGSANDTIEDLNHDLRAVHDFLFDPYRAARKERARRLTEARVEVRERTRELEFVLLQGMPATSEWIRQQTELVEEARNRLFALEREPELAADLREFTQSRIQQAEGDLKHLASLGVKLDRLSKKAEGCYGTARGDVRSASALENAASARSDSRGASPSVGR